MKATVSTVIDQVDADNWDRAVRDSGAPLFYRHAFLTAAMAHPLQEILDARFVLFWRDGEPQCGLPVFRVAAASSIVADADSNGGEGVWVSHTAHWYDSRLPCRDEVRTVLEALPGTLAELGIGRLLLQNVGDPALLDAAAAAGLERRDYDSRYRLDLRPHADYDSWVDSRGRATRRNLRRAARRADSLGWTVASPRIGEADLDRLIQLCRVSTAKHGNTEWLPVAQMRGFLRALPEPNVVTHQIRDASGNIVAAVVGLHDGPHYHSWSGGIDRDLTAGNRIDANLLLYRAELGWAFDHGCETFEGGRRSGELKRRLGMSEVPLSAIGVPGAPCD